MSVDEKMRYIQKVKESAKAIWGIETTTRFNSHIEQIAEAVYVVLNYPLDSEVEPVTKMRPGD